MGFRERAEEWAWEELREVKRAPAAFIVASILALALGVFGGWLGASFFFAQRVEVLEQRLQLAQEQLAAKGWPPTPVAAVAPPTTQSTRTAWGVAAIFALTCALLLISGRRKHRTIHAQLSEAQDANRLASLERAKFEIARDAAVAALKETKHKHAIETLERMSNLRLQNGATPTVTIRYVSYGSDYELAIKIRDLFAKHVKWPVTLDVSNNPALERADKFKVVFDIGMGVFLYGELVHALSEGDLLGVPIGERRYVDRNDTNHLIVLVLPSADASAIHAKAHVEGV